MQLTTQEKSGRAGTRARNDRRRKARKAAWRRAHPGPDGAASAEASEQEQQTEAEKGGELVLDDAVSFLAWTESDSEALADTTANTTMPVVQGLSMADFGEDEFVDLVTAELPVASRRTEEEALEEQREAADLALLVASQNQLWDEEKQFLAEQSPEETPIQKWTRVKDDTSTRQPAPTISSSPIMRPQHQESIYHFPNATVVPEPIKRYYRHRTSLFSLYHLFPGIHMTGHCWYSVTPETIALKIAAHMLDALRHPATIIDMFAGSGGNTIAFARHPKCRKVIAIESDPQVIACGMHNANLYGVGHKICWMLGDSFAVLDGQTFVHAIAHEAGEGGVKIFASPPWGGPEYKNDRIFDVEEMRPYSIEAIMEAIRDIPALDVCLYLPRNSNMAQIKGYFLDGEEELIVAYKLNGYTKAVCAYFHHAMSPRYRWSKDSLDEDLDHEDARELEQNDEFDTPDHHRVGDVASSEWVVRTNSSRGLMKYLKKKKKRMLEEQACKQKEDEDADFRVF